jgi:small-conductance mechanosensitive channel
MVFACNYGAPSLNPGVFSGLPPRGHTGIIRVMDELRRTVVKFLAEYGFQIIGALIIMFAGGMAARWLGRVADQWFEKKQVEPPIRMLAVRVLRLLVFGLATVLALEKCGVPIAPMVAGIGVAGVGIMFCRTSSLASLSFSLSRSASANTSSWSVSKGKSAWCNSSPPL